MKNLFILAVMLFAATTLVTAQKLETGKTFEREIGGEEKHSYEVQLKKNDVYNLTVEQQGVDVVLRIFAPSGTLADYIDSPNGRKGDEALVVVVPESGNYRVEISPLEKDADKGKYLVRTVAVRPAIKEELAEAQLKNQLMNLIRDEFTARERGDKSFFEGFLADDYIRISGDTVSNKALFISGVAKPPDGIELKVTPSYWAGQVRSYGDMALLTHIENMEVQSGGQKNNFKARRVNLFRRDNGKWHLVASHGEEIKNPPADPPIVKTDAKTLKEYTGQYSLGTGVNMNVESDGEKLIVYFDDPNNKVKIYPMGNETFFMKGSGVRYIFVRDTSGKVIEVRQGSDGQEFKFKKIK